METPATTGPKSSIASNSKELAAQGGNLAALLNELLNNPEYGTWVHGVVVAADEPERREGVSQKTGRKYEITSRRIRISTPQGEVICSEMQDDLTLFKPVQLYAIVKWRVTRSRMDGSQMVHNVEVA